jgi:hypothetical protein
LRRSAEAVAAVALLACSAASPETEVREALARLSAVEVAAGDGARVALAPVRFSDVAVSMDGARARVIAVVEADGRVRLAGGEPALAYVGRETFSMERCAGARWCLADGALEGLRGVVAALAAEPRAEGVRVAAWQVRVERDRAEAGEDYEAPDGGATRRLRARHALAREGAAWRLLPPP